MHIRRTGTGVALAVATALGSVAQVQAQQATAALEEIVVTAERRETALQDTPISIVALSEETLAQKGVEDLSDVALFTPNLSINGGRGAGNNAPNFTIRGISGGGGTTSERGVALYIDGIFVPRTSGSVFRVFDIERVEVLRGPQGTLFGRNSTGGAIRVVTKQPSQDFEAYVRGTVGNFSRTDVAGMVNLPLSDAVAIRAQAAYLKQDGYVTRGTQELGGSRDVLARLQAAFQFTDDVKLTIGLLRTDATSDGTPQDYIQWDMAPSIIQGNYADWMSDALQLAGQARLGITDDPRIILDDYTLPSFCLLDDFNPDWDEACAQRNDNLYTQADAQLTWKISDTMDFTSTSGVAKLDHRGNTDWQLLGMEFRPDDVQSKVLYQEFQLNMELFGGAVDAVTGLNYFREISSSDGQVVTRRGTSTYTGAGGLANGNADAGLFITAASATEQMSRSYGWFNSATWHITPQWNLTGGARLAYDYKDIEQTRRAAADFVPAPGTTSTTVTADDSWKQVDWRGTLDYHFTPDLMAYATVSKAYRAGQYSITVLPNVRGELQSDDFINPIPPEKVLNYETGLRATLFDQRLRINPTLYYMQWTNRQAARQVSCVAEGPAACPIGFRINVVNSGDVDLYGMELDAQLAVTSNFTLDGAMGITKYDLKDPVANSGPNLFPSQASPTFNIGATYTLPTDGRGDFAFNANYAWVGEQETHPTSGTDSAYRMPGYGLVNARLQWVSPSGANRVSLFANNLTDEHYATYATRFGGGYWDSGAGTAAAAPPRSALSVTRGRPREFGITVQHDFGRE